jgi:NADPH-dependent curcumin reductase CurA
LLCSGQQQVQGGQDLMGELLERATPWVRDRSLKHKEDIVDGPENAPEAFSACWTARTSASSSSR